MERLRADLAEHVRRSAARAAAEGSGDLVRLVACQLPLQAIAGWLGVPAQDRGKLFDWSNQTARSSPPTIGCVRHPK
ncbi:hypothetical protein ACX9NE_22145 [Mycobacterium sp. ML4]